MSSLPREHGVPVVLDSIVEKCPRCLDTSYLTVYATVAGGLRQRIFRRAAMSAGLLAPLGEQARSAARRACRCAR